MRVSNPFYRPPATSQPALQSKSNKHSNLERNGQLTLIASIEGTRLHAFLEGSHRNSESIEAGFSQLGTNLLALLKKHLPDPMIEIGDTITPASLDPNLSEDASRIFSECMDRFEKKSIQEEIPIPIPNGLSIEWQFNAYARRLQQNEEDARTEDLEELPSKGLRIVSGNGDFYDDAFNFYLHPPIEDVDATLAMNADMLDEKDNPNLPLEKRAFEMVLTHLLQNELLKPEQLKRMFAYETEYKADQGIGFIPKVMTDNNVLLITRFDRSLSVDA
ncbi:MAG: hypothetical protein ACK551_08705 [Vampirovibrionales bacterium]